MNTSCGGDPKKMFHRLLENWENNPPSPYNWGTLLNILVSPILKQDDLAEDIAEKLRSSKFNMHACHLLLIHNFYFQDH